MKNRYGNEYNFEKVDENTYTIVGDLSYWRFGGREGQERMDMNDLGFVDPSGGPFIQVGAQIDGREIVRIRASGDLDGAPSILFEVE
jgi:hypothetical protein